MSCVRADRAGSGDVSCGQAKGSRGGLASRRAPPLLQMSGMSGKCARMLRRELGRDAE